MPSLVPRAEDVAELKDVCGLLDRPVHLLVAHAAERRAVKDVVCHVAPKGTVPRFLLEASSGLLVEGPGLCLLHEAGRLPLPRLVEFGFELCGGYRLDSDDPRGFADCEPLTNRSELVRFLRAVKGAKGARQLGRAISYVREDSRSPMETVVVLLLCLPPRFGGYGLPFPRLNYRVDTNRRGCKVSADHYYLCDAFWPEARLDVEYDSDFAHTGSSRIARDAKRRNGLVSLGVTVITATKQQVFDCDEMDRLARVVAGRLGRRLRMEGSGWTRARAELRRQLLGFGEGRRRSGG